MISTCSRILIIWIFVVGREGILAGPGNKEVHCGRRLVSGLFARPRLPLGYSYVTTVPRGACRLNISEIVPSENYIALKISNSSYIMNGEFAVSTPGIYEAAGTRFLYTRVAGLDTVFGVGPTNHPIDIMILYTQPNPSLKYAYFTESLGDGDPETSSIGNNTLLSNKHSRRHHAFDQYPKHGFPRHPDLTGGSKVDNSGEELEENIVGTRKFVWKIVSYTQCSRSCGGGIQIGKHRCVEIFTNGKDREVSQVHCTGSPPPAKRRRCNNASCPPRWRAASWSSCPKCGLAFRTRIVGCVQDHFRGITKVNDQKCFVPKPATKELCDIPKCDGNTIEGEKIESKAVVTRDQTDTFHDGPVYSVALNGSDVGPEYNYNGAKAANWLHTEWSNCVGWCVGGGLQSRGVRCTDPAGCAPWRAPSASRTCTIEKHCDAHHGQWFTGEWSPCSSMCGGKQIRGVLCIGDTGRHLRDIACKEPKPDRSRDCGTECSPTWYFSDWSQCIGNCTSGIGLQRRTVWCARGETEVSTESVAGNKAFPEGAEAETACTDVRPPAQKECQLTQCQNTSTFPPDISIESQKEESAEDLNSEVEDTEEVIKTKDCEDKLTNCVLAVQARLCHYNYYIQNCCDSCKDK